MVGEPGSKSWPTCTVKATARKRRKRKKSPSSKKQLNAGCEQRKIWSFFCVIVNEEDDESIPKEFMDHTQVLGLEGFPFQRSAARLLNLFVSRFLAFSILSLSLKKKISASGSVRLFFKPTVELFYISLKILHQFLM